MFDRITVGRTHREYIPYEKAVHEHRAPTDDSMRLYGEMQRQVREELVKSLRSGDNEMRWALAIFHDMMTMGWRVQAEVVVNGHVMRFSWGMEMDASDDQVVRQLHHELATKLAEQMIRDFMANGWGR